MRKKQPTIEYNPSNEVHGYKNVRWVENVSHGLRRIGFADEVMHREGYSLDHKGWFTHNDGDGGEVYRGVVYQLPARHGLTQYVYGYDDPCNEGAALLCFDITTHKCDAAKHADRFAEIFAEYERDYNRACDARQRFETLAEDVSNIRKGALALGVELRALQRSGQYPATVETLRKEICSLYRSICKARKEREELKDTYGHAPGFEE